MKRNYLSLLILLVGLTFSSVACKKSKSYDDLSGTYDVSCQRTLGSQTSNFAPVWIVDQVNNASHTVTGQGTGFPFGNGTFNFSAEDGNLTIDDSGFKGSGTYSSNTMQWNFTDSHTATSTVYTWSCTCTKK